MKTKLSVIVLLAVISLMLVLRGSTYAQSRIDHQPLRQQTISNTVYLPIVSKPPCTWALAAVYVATSGPVVRVGEIVTVAGAIVNECSLVGQPTFYVYTDPPSILSPWRATQPGYPPSVPIGGYEEVTFTLQAVGTGVVTVTTAVNYETATPLPPSVLYYVTVGSSPSVIRVLP